MVSNAEKHLKLFSWHFINIFSLNMYTIAKLRESKIFIGFKIKFENSSRKTFPFNKQTKSKPSFQDKIKKMHSFNFSLRNTNRNLCQLSDLACIGTSCLMILFSPGECAQAAVRLHCASPNFSLSSLGIHVLREA